MIRSMKAQARVAVTVSLFVAHVASASTTSSVHQISLQMAGPYPVVEARIAGYERPLRLIVDTAAGASALDRALIEELDLLDGAAPAVQVRGASGTSQSVQFAKQLQLQLAEARFALKPLVTDMARFSYGHDRMQPAPRFDGIVGNDLLRRFDVRFDVPGQLLTLSEPRQQAGPAAEACQANAFGADRPELLSGFALIELSASAERHTASVPAVVDTGAAQTLFNWAAVEQLGFAKGDARLRERAQGTRGFSGHAAQTFLADLSALGFADWTTGPLQVRVADLPVFAALGLGEQPAVILGIDALRQTPLSISAGVGLICVG